MTASFIGSKTGKGTKFCDKCNRNGTCTDTRQEPGGYVRRRYKCITKGCTHRWTTVEYKIAPAKGSKFATEARFMSTIEDKVRKEFQGELKVLLGLAK